MRILNLLFLCFSFLVILSIVSVSKADSLKSDQELKELPNVKSKAVGKISKGEIQVIEKKGFWVKVKKDSVEGWTKLNNVKIEKDSNLSLSSLNTGREGSGNIVSTSGVRGLDGEDITNAQPDMNEFEKLKKLTVQKSAGETFSQNSKLITKKIEFIIVKTQNSNNNSSTPYGR